MMVRVEAILISQLRLPGVPGSSVSRGGPPWPKTDDTYAMSSEINTDFLDISHTSRVDAISHQNGLVSLRLSGPGGVYRKPSFAGNTSRATSSAASRAPPAPILIWSCESNDARGEFL